MLKRFFAGAFKRARAAPPSLDAIVAEAARAAEEENWSRAMALYARAVCVAPELAQAHVGLALAELRLGYVGDAIDSCEAALRLDPDNMHALMQLGSACYRIGDGDRVRAIFGKLQQLAPTQGRAIATALVLPSLADSVEEIESVRARLAAELDRLALRPPRVDDPAAEVGVTAFYLAYHGRNDRDLQERIAALHLAACPQLAWVAPHCRSPRPRTRAQPLRIGIVSRFLYRHSIGRVVQGLVETLDRTRFSVHACAFAKPVDDVSRAIEANADGWLVLPRSLAAARETLAGLALDVLLYPDIGMDPLTYFMSFARLAPVQCTTWGHPLTSGVPNLDYFLSTDHFEPPGAQEHYSETLVTLEDVAFPGYLHCPDPPPFAPAPAVGFDRGRRVYFCPQALFKFHPDFDPILAAILERDSGGEIVISYDVELDIYRLPRLKARLRRTARHVYDRIVFMPRADRFETFRQRLAACEVVLDPVHYCGGNTSLDAIGAGALIVTLPSGYNRGRHTYGFFRKMRYTDTVATTPEHYVDLAVRIATDRDVRIRLQRAQAQRVHALYEEVSAVRQIESFFEEALAERLPVA